MEIAEERVREIAREEIAKALKAQAAVTVDAVAELHTGFMQGQKSG